VAERNRRDDDAAEERVDDVFDDAVDDDAIDDSFDDDEDAAAEGEGKKRKGGTAVKAKVKSDSERSAVRFGVVGRFFLRIGLFFREIVAELRKVIWPTRNELLTYTAVVVVFMVVMTAIVAGFDYLYAKGVLFVFGNPKQ
jgi:preprotein translocase subunit SecE